MIEYRNSPVSRAGIACLLVLGAAGLIISLATGLRFADLPNIAPLVTGVVLLDFLTRFAPQSRNVAAVRTMIYGALYLVVASFCGVLAAYGLQRLALPLQDQLFQNFDLAMGIRWFDWAHWIDRHPVVRTMFFYAYRTMPLQVALPLLVFAFTQRVDKVRVYLLTFTIAVVITIVVAAFVPAAGPTAIIDESALPHLQFAGATPIDHLFRLRIEGPAVLFGDPGGIVSFPSLHATVAVLTPFVLRNYRWLFLSLLFVNSSMLGGTISEGGHYVCDIYAGIAVAFFAYALAKRIILIEDRFRVVVPAPARKSAATI